MKRLMLILGFLLAGCGSIPGSATPSPSGITCAFVLRGDVDRALVFNLNPEAVSDVPDCVKVASLLSVPATGMPLDQAMALQPACHFALRGGTMSVRAKVKDYGVALCHGMDQNRHDTATYD